MNLKHITVRVKPEILNYVDILADTFSLPRTYVIRRLLEIAVQLHRDGFYDFPSGQIDYKLVCNRFLQQLRKEGE